MKFNLSDPQQLQSYRNKTELLIAEGKTVEIAEPSNTRTPRQNSALHVYFQLLATELNQAGLSMMKVLKPSAEIPWTPQSVKEYLWKPIQNAQLQKQSTTKLDTKEVSAVYDTLNRHLGETTGVHVPFPENTDFVE